MNKWLTPNLAPRPLWPHTHFGPKDTLAQGTFRFDEYFGLMLTSAWKYLNPKQLRPNTLQQENQIFKYVILRLP